MESVDHGYDLHLKDINDPYHSLEQALMYTYVALLISNVALTFSKVTIKTKTFRRKTATLVFLLSYLCYD
jgi:hypothetical protein